MKVEMEKEVKIISECLWKGRISQKKLTNYCWAVNVYYWFGKTNNVSINSKFILIPLLCSRSLRIRSFCNSSRRDNLSDNSKFCKHRDLDKF